MQQRNNKTYSVSQALIMRPIHLLFGLIKCAVFLPVVLGYAAPCGAQDIAQILSKVRDANTSVQYRGVLTTVFFNTPFTKVYQYQIAKDANGHRREELLSSGPNKEINFDDGTYLWRFFPNKRLVIKEKSRLANPLPPHTENNVALLKQNYDIKITEEKVDGRTGYKVLFSPKLPNRPMQIYWIDAHTGLPLKIERYGEKNTLLSVSSFSAIDFQPKTREASDPLMVPPKTAIAEIEEKGNLTRCAAEDILQTKLPTPTYLPEGFTLRNIALRSHGPRKTIHFFYTDGLSALSVFHRPYEAGDMSTPFTTQDPQNSDALLLTTTGTLNTIRLRSDQLTITLMGDIFRQELIKVAESIAPIAPSNPFRQPRNP